MWRALRDDFANDNFELITVGQDALGAEGCRAFIEAAGPTHPALIDEHHVLANLYGITNIPQAVWIDEDFNIVRSAEAAPPPPAKGAPPRPDVPADVPQRMADIMQEASKIETNPTAYHAALEDWVRKGAESEYALDPQTVIERSTPRDKDRALGHAHFELACELERRGQHDLAIEHFRRSHELVPDSWTFRRQAWSLERVVDGPFARFWQGPDPDNPEAWPYEGDWLSDIKAAGAENYYDPFEP